MEREKLREQQAKAAQEYLRAAALEASGKEELNVVSLVVLYRPRHGETRPR